MNNYTLKIEFEAGKNKGQVWQFSYLNESQVAELFESLPIKVISCSNITVSNLNSKNSGVDIFSFLDNY